MPMNTAGIYAWLDSFYGGDEPIAVAVSGGADSMALLHLAMAYAADRPVHAIIIDHALRESSAGDTAAAAGRMTAMGAKVHIRTWAHEGVKTAVQERAREARYALLAQVCRELGARKLLVGHTQDDQAETVGMRIENGSAWRGLAGIRDRVTAPIWPHTRGLTLGRPLLQSSRGDIRDYCLAKAIAFYDDPSNEDIKYQRVRVRAQITDNPAKRAEWLALQSEMSERREIEDGQVRAWMSNHMRRIENAGVEFPRTGLKTMPDAALADMLRLVSGRARRADMAAAARLRAHIDMPDFAARTLGGALVFSGANNIGLARDPGAHIGRRGSVQKGLRLNPGVTDIWDGRFKISTDQEGVHVSAFWPGRAQLDEAGQRALKTFPAPMRKTLPGFFRGEVLLAVPALKFAADTGQFIARDITFMRF